MPRKRTRQKRSEEEHTHLAIRVERCEASVEARINYDVYAPQHAWDLDDDDPLYQFTTQLTLVGIATYPEGRAGDSYELTIYGSDSDSRRVSATVKDVQERDEHASPKYRQYRGRQIPIYNPPSGMGLIDKIRGEPRWTAWLRVPPRFTSDALALLSDGRTLFLAIHERKKDRARWIQSVRLQTIDPAEE
ncbi:MAG: hypothetical protein EOQ86_19595 [Mesorhizobium sp.]|uniref:hypothetical protein n=1 Tax=Mesorhizobium sp. TaxID=1871066 RepID=UPI000FE8CD96|nr:hypothetical protein [Mesorhizobium sp.]RWH76836.1 MAG: hypothetical protein EOQ85_20065 [Mesorhizobium sp.]RWH80145.1 MAG: hypothetical protein EOQ86_19595 [Mesorhizobium sp.]RWH88776.1 MAG: hypothetical protein EOQ87_20485 [Mesorhizobium sp.]RWH95633.1 MAG: hypothetical protein EOQ88_22615 [Mesorhizobium sp.]RWI01319.1 MAG: hypothetical protein EOQ89_16830 [Mesorhizobium sp.]